MQKKKYILVPIILFLIVIAVVVGYFMISGSKDNSISNVKGNLIISTFSEKGKGDILFYNLENNEGISLISDADVAINGDLSEDGSEVAYANAKGDGEQWQIYIHNVNKKIRDDKKFTDDENGKSSPRFGSGNLVYYLMGDTSGRMQISKLDIDTNSSVIIDDKSGDCQVDAMDVMGDKVIMSSTSNSLYIKSWEENEGEDKPIKHSIYETDKDGNNLNKIVDFNASAVESISYTPSGNQVIISGYNIDGTEGEGIYKVSLDNGKIETLLNNQTLLENGSSIISGFASPNICKMSLDEKIIYFTGVPANSNAVEIEGIECFATAIFSYNIENKEIKKIYEPEDASFIFDLNIKY